MYQIKQLQYLPEQDEFGNNPNDKYLVFTDTDDDQKGIDVGWVYYARDKAVSPITGLSWVAPNRDISWRGLIFNKEIWCNYGSRDKIPDNLKEEIQRIFEEIINRSIIIVHDF